MIYFCLGTVSISFIHSWFFPCDAGDLTAVPCGQVYQSVEERERVDKVVHLSLVVLPFDGRKDL